MINHKKETLKPLLYSSDGIHLTCYLVNNGDLSHIKTQLEMALTEAQEFLYPVQSKEEITKFLSPIHSLIKDDKIFINMKGNIGLFRNKDSFRILTIPIEVGYQCHIADSFHVKPLLKWIQLDRDFLLLGIKKEMILIYFGNQTTLQLIGTILTQTSTQEDSIFWLKDILKQYSSRSAPRLFIAGDTSYVGKYLSHIDYKNFVKTPLSSTFTDNNLIEICSNIRKILKSDAKRTLEKALYEFHIAEKLNVAKKNIFQIAKAAIQGKIKKLIIAEGVNVFGKINKKTGGLAIHPFDLDHEDDDLLDDLAQTVLLAGGEVYIVPKEQIPQERPILAILEAPDSPELKFDKRTTYLKNKESEIIL